MLFVGTLSVPVIFQPLLLVVRWLGYGNPDWLHEREHWEKHWQLRWGCGSHTTHKTGRDKWSRSRLNRARAPPIWALRKVLSCRWVSSRAFPLTKLDSPHPYVWPKLQAHLRRRLAAKSKFKIKYKSWYCAFKLFAQGLALLIAQLRALLNAQVILCGNKGPHRYSKILIYRAAQKLKTSQNQK